MRRAMEMIRVARRIASWLVALQIPLLAAFPRPDGYVNDFASILAEADEAYLENFLWTVEGETYAPSSWCHRCGTSRLAGSRRKR